MEGHGSTQNDIRKGISLVTILGDQVADKLEVVIDQIPNFLKHNAQFTRFCNLGIGYVKREISKLGKLVDPILYGWKLIAQSFFVAGFHGQDQVIFLQGEIGNQAGRVLA